MSVFETATQEVRSMHNENTLRRLEHVSADYYWAQEEIKKKIIKIMYGNIRKNDIIEDVRLFKYAT
ncbi:hypothetical protein [Pelosinus sp. UFO1]|uniref:hypothetical protein n=1 Tax=Pelosinus sp. UFO1 TaxID=484770 RepID=UPI0004D11A19|nr:hypothetical protein [Pelosinus sp. UFO1]AIF53519.1 hypothetical protein UFO1_3976 [Pelosinus sp. UFO1]